jgi:hypothetical protein
MKIIIVVIVATALFILIGCQEKGAVEKTGARIDEIVDNIEDGDPALKRKGPMEKMGESIDETIDKN